MRIRAGHIVLVALACVTLFMLYATFVVRRNQIPEPAYDGLAPPMGMSIAEAPEIALDTDALDLGVIPHDRDTTVEVVVFNRGRRPLEIHDVRSSCPLCTVGEFEAGGNRIAPDGSSKLLVTVKPDGVLGFHTIKTLTLMTNDPRNPQAQLTVEAHIDPEFSLEPEEFDFGLVRKGGVVERTMFLRQRVDEPIAVQSVDMRPRDAGDSEEFAPIQFDVTLLPENEWHDAGRRAYRIVASLSPYMSAGDFQVPVFIRTDLKRFPYHHIFARGTVEAPYTLDLGLPGTVLYLREPQTMGRIAVKADTPFLLTEVSSENEHVRWRMETPTPEESVIVCAPNPMNPRGIHKDAIIFYVEMNGERYPERVAVHVYAHGSEENAMNDEG